MATRKETITKIEQLHNSRLICYATSDRQKLEAQISGDMLQFLSQQLSKIGKVPRLDLLIYSRGGDTLTGFTLANVLREFADHVSVLIPFRAHSCATLIALGANEIVMGPFGQLSPIDPTITTPHSPTIEREGTLQFLPVSVEDVGNYIELAKKEVGLKGEQHLAEVLGHLCQRVSPLALGAVYRAREQIGMLATKLLKLHIDEAERIEPLVRQLTREFLSHDYVISRREAKEIRLPVTDATPELTAAMWEIFEDLAKELQLAEAWNPEKELKGSQSAQRTTTRAILESRELKHVFQTTFQLKRVSITQQGIKVDGVNTSVVDEGWK